MGEERFPLPAFVGMISDEIDQLRQHGKTDADISAMIESAIGKTVSADEIAQFYATPDQCHPNE